MTTKGQNDISAPLSERVEALVYYGTGDEGVELFRQTCGLAYMEAGIGSDEHAETLYLWAKEQAEASRKWCEDHEPESLDDTENGHWGYA